MKLGNFWGMTAPILVLADYDQEHLKEAFSRLRDANSEALHNFKIELAALEKVRLLQTASLPIQETEMISNKHKLDYELNCGKLPTQLETDQYVNEFCALLAVQIVNGEREGKYVTVSVPSMRQTVIDFLATKSEKLLKTKAMVKSLYRTLVGGNISISQELIQTFGLVLQVPDKITVNGIEYELDTATKKIIQWYVDRVPNVMAIYGLMNGSVEEEQSMFGVYFYDLIKAKPTSLYYKVVNQFSPANQRTAQRLPKSMILNIRDNVKADILKFEAAIKQNVEVFQSVSSPDLFSYDKFTEACGTFSTNKREFFTALVFKSILHPDDLLIKDFDILSRVYDFVASITPEFLNETFGVELTYEEWEKEFRFLCNFRICGLSFYSLRLFEVSIANTPLVASKKVQKDAEYLEECYTVIDNVKALVATIIPIGEELEVS